MRIKSRKFWAATATLATAVGISLLGTSSANADESQINLSASDVAKLHSFFDKFDVDAATQDDLISSFRGGEKWDSYSSSAQPVAITKKNVDGLTWDVAEFADGSVRATSIGDAPTEPGTMKPYGVNNCGYSAGKTGNFSDCSIYYWVGSIASNFKADFTINKSGYDKITSAWGEDFTAIGSCGVNVPKARVVKGTESSTGKAKAGYSPSATMCVTGYSTTFPSYLYVGNNSASHVFQ